ncbi:MAG: alpha/beta hydrolase [Agathobacter sp.]|nr:alpha/beta hydrolase [Agathobacter sp.]
MKKNTKKIIFLSAAAIVGMYVYNKIVETNATNKNLLKTDDGEFYQWKEGKVFYTKNGSGAPLLLIHDTDPRSSGTEWSKINKKLSKNYTVYTVDLLGCGRSDKPALKYTNYMYVQLITSFIKDVIGSPCNVIATNLSTSFIIMANTLDNNLFKKIIFINPISLSKLESIPNKLCELKQLLISTPLIGTFIYNRLNTPIKIDLAFKNRYILKNQLITSKLKNCYYEAAHLNHSNGKYLFSSILSNYINLNVNHAIKKIDKPIFIIGSRELKNNLSTLEQYKKMNSNFEITHISGANLYPQLEIPEKMLKLIEKNL